MLAMYLALTVEALIALANVYLQRACQVITIHQRLAVHVNVIV